MAEQDELAATAYRTETAAHARDEAAEFRREMAEGRRELSAQMRANRHVMVFTQLATTLALMIFIVLFA